MNLLDAIAKADGIEIDGVFVRYFNIEEYVTEADEICIAVEVTDSDFNLWSWSFTLEDCENASYNPDAENWKITTADDEFEMAVFRFETIGDK